MAERSLADRGAAAPVSRQRLPERDETIETGKKAAGPAVEIITTEDLGDPSRHDPRQRRAPPERQRRETTREEPDQLRAAIDRAHSAESRTGQVSRERDDAMRTAHGATVALLREREQSATQRLESAKQAKLAAGAAMTTARESGNIAAEQTAIDQLSQANYDIRDAERALEQVEADKQRVGKAPAQTPTPDGGGASGYPPQDQAWIAAHPAFNTDRRYRSLVISKATEAQVVEGLTAGTPAYYDWINRELDDELGAGHGQAGWQPPRAGRREEERGSSTAMPRGETANGSGGFSGEEELRTLDGSTVFVSTGPNGSPRVRMSSATAAEWKKAAEWLKMTPEDYTLHQVEAARERAQGGTGGLMIEGGRNYT